MADVPYDSGFADARSDPTFLGSIVKRTSWGAILAGSVTAITVQMVLTVLGVAIGVTTAQVNITPDAQVQDGIKLAVVLWWVVTGTLSLFAGGCVVGRFAGMTRSPDVLLHAFSMWAITAIFGFLAVTMGAGALYGTTMNSYGSTHGVLTQNNSATNETSGSSTDRDVTADRRVDAETVRRFTQTASWWTLASLLLGIGASLAGCWMATPERIVLTSPMDGAPNNRTVRRT